MGLNIEMADKIRIMIEEMVVIINYSKVRKVSGLGLQGYGVWDSKAMPTITEVCSYEQI